MADSRRSDILFTFLVAILLLAAWHVRSVLLIIYVSAIFAVVLGPGVNFIRKIGIGRWHPGRGIAMLILIVGVLTLLTLFFVFAIPPIYHDMQSFSKDLPNKIPRLLARVRELPFAHNIDEQAVESHILRAAGGALGLFAGIAGGILGFFSWVVLTAYFIIDGERAFHWGLSLFPAHRRPKLQETMLRAENRVSKWLLGQLALMLILGSLSTIVFWALGVKYFYALGVFCGIANIIPIVGPVISVSFAALIAASDSWTKALGVVIFYLVYQQIENAFLTPRIMKTTVDLPALAVVVALAIGGTLAGILGALVAVPTAALIAVILDEYVVKRNGAAA